MSSIFRKNIIMIVVRLSLVCLLAALVMVNGSFIFAEGNTDEIFSYVENGISFSYTVKDNKITIHYIIMNSADSLTDGTLVIPSKIDDMKVVAVNKNAAFWIDDNVIYKIRKIICSNYMTTVDMMSFYPIESLQEIVLGKYTKRFITILRDYEKDNYILFNITVPKDAKYLKTVKGALYSKDGTILFRTPKVSVKGDKYDNWKSFRVSSKVRRIYKYTFLYNAQKVIRLGGNIRKIDKGAFKNSGGLLFKVPKNKVKKYKKLIKKAGGTLGKTKWQIRVKGY